MTDQNSQDLENIKTHRLFIWVLLAQFALAIILGFTTDTLVLGVAIGFSIILLPVILSKQSPGSALSRHVIAIATQLMTSLHIQQTMGMTEMHFQVFVMLAFLSFFRDWKVIVSGTAVVAIHHILGYASQHVGGGIYAFEDAQPTLIILFVHIAFASIECLVLAFMVHKASGEYEAAKQLNSAVSKIMATDGVIDLSQNNIPEHKELATLHKMLSAVRALAQRSTSVGENLLTIAEKVNTSTLELDNSVNDKNTQVSSISDSMKNITESINEVANLSRNANSIADGAKSSTKETRSSIESSQSNIAHLKSTLETTSVAIGDLSGKCENIATVMQSIKSVAEQTNLLALNAAIESARAGEHGRGFAVVADEVRNLAIKSKESAEEIEKIMQLLTDSANNSVDNMNNCVNMVDLAVESSESASSNMLEVFSSIEQVNNNVTNVASSATEQANVTEAVSHSTDNLHNLYSAERDQVANLQHDVAQLNDLADELSCQLKSFKLD